MISVRTEIIKEQVSLILLCCFHPFLYLVMVRTLLCGFCSWRPQSSLFSLGFDSMHCVFTRHSSFNKLWKSSISWNFHPLPLELFGFEGLVLELIGLNVRQILSIKLSFLILTMKNSVVISSVLLFGKIFIWPKS